MSNWHPIIDTESHLFAWADLDAANAWFREAQRLCSPASVAAADAAGWSTQRRTILAAWAALSNAYRALTIPATQDPGYSLNGGSTSGAPRSAAARQRDTSNAFLALADRTRAIFAAVGFDGNPWPFPTSRARLDEQSNVVVTNLDDNDPATGFNGLYSGCATIAASGAVTRGCDPYTWRTIAWQDVAFPDDLHLVDVLPPAIWSLDAARTIADAGVARGAQRVLFDTRLNVVAKNVAEAERLHMNLDALPGAALTVPLDQERLSAAARENARNQVATFAAAATAIAAAANPIAGLIVGIVGAAATFLAANSSIGWDPSLQPNFAEGVISRGGDVDNEPLYTVDMPPGVARPRYLTDVGAAAISALTAPIDAAAILAAANTDCARWAAAGVSRQSDSLAKLGYPATRTTEILAAIRTFCAGADANDAVEAAKRSGNAALARRLAGGGPLLPGDPGYVAPLPGMPGYTAPPTSAAPIPTWVKVVGVLAVGLTVEEIMRRRAAAATR